MSLRIGTLRAGTTNLRKLIDFRQIPRGRGGRVLAVSKPRGEHRRVRILHFSDIHLGLGLGHIPLSDWASKRLAGGANLLRGRGKRFSAAADKTRAMVRLAGELDTDLVLCTGDLTALATDAEFDAARSIFDPLMGDRRFVVIPGNHDLYTRRDDREQRFTRRFASSLESDLPELCTDGPWPIVRLPAEDVAVIAVNSARPILLASSGHVSDAQIEGLRAALVDPRVAGRFVFLMTHYAPCRADGSPDTKQHGLDNVDDLLDAATGVERGAYLCGHIHTTFRQRIAGFAGEVFCAGSSTLGGREGFWLFESGTSGWEARRGRWSGDDYVVDPPDPGDLVTG
jgi:3',5'-cyclic AMP phosphodiesterase CpdA